MLSSSSVCLQLRQMSWSLSPHGVYESHYGPLNAQFSQSASVCRWGNVVEGAFYV